jgi:hypothetical protein
LARRPNGLAEWAPRSIFIPAQFEDRFIFILDNTGEIVYRYGDPRGRIKIVNAEHHVECHPGTIRLKTAQCTFKDERGKETTMTAKACDTFYLTGGGYGGYKDYYHGKYQGEYHIETDMFDLSDSEFMKQIAGRDDHVCEFRIGDEVGYGIYEVGVRGEQPYAYAPYSPPAKAKTT